jgi:hypothetical protein
MSNNPDLGGNLQFCVDYSSLNFQTTIQIGSMRKCCTLLWWDVDVLPRRAIELSAGRLFYVGGSEVEEIVAEAISGSKSNGRDKQFIQVELVASFSENGEINHVAPSPL